MKTASAPRRFLLSINTEDIIFNNHVQLDTIVINGKSILHLADNATPFSAVVFFLNKSTVYIW